MKKLICLFLFVIAQVLPAQEGLRELSCNLNYFYSDLKKEGAEQPGKPVTQKKPTSLFLPFKEDFFYGSVNKYPRQDLWADSTVYINTGFARAPPSIGIATFDGLNKFGYPYKLAPLDLNASSPADTLTSQPINLHQSSLNATLTPANKVALTFYYQARGYGENPEANDSLMCDLYKPLQKKWVNRVWIMKGNANPNTNDSTFRRVYIGIHDTGYFHDGFRFRFRNTATTVGNFDHWHIDYIYFNEGRDSIADTLYDDVTFSRVPTPFLKDYSAMPFRQFTSSEMSDNNSVLIQNIYKDPINISYNNVFYDDSKTQVYNYNAGLDNINPFRKSGYMANKAFSNPASQPTFTYSFPDPLPKPQAFTIKHYVYRSGPSNDFIIENDTVVQRHPFYDYYAYDDGSPEAGYYVNGANGKMVVKIRVNTVDTLRALRIYFDPAPIGSAEKFYFKILVRSGGLPGFELNTSDSLYYPRFIDSLSHKAIPEYQLAFPIYLQPGEYYIGIQQQVSTGLVVGFDRNYDSHKNIYFDPGSGFEQSGIRGSLMIRPVFGVRVGDPTGVTKLYDHPNNVQIFPNPADDAITVRMKTNDSRTELIVTNVFGQAVNRVAVEGEETTINTAELPSGIYFLTPSGTGKNYQTRKIVISH